MFSGARLKVFFKNEHKRTWKCKLRSKIWRALFESPFQEKARTKVRHASKLNLSKYFPGPVWPDLAKLPFMGLLMLVDPTYRRQEVSIIQSFNCVRIYLCLLMALVRRSLFLFLPCLSRHIKALAMCQIWI